MTEAIHLRMDYLSVTIGFEFLRQNSSEDQMLAFLIFNFRNGNPNVAHVLTA